MYYRICDNVALRSWRDVKYAYYTKGVPFALPLTLKQAETMLLCDGEHDLDMDPAVMLLASKKLIELCEKGEHPSAWSAYRSYDNLYFPKINFMITGKCNYNCLHCFNAVDNAPIMTEWSFAEICDLLDQAEQCGINSFTITGGEPMLHKHFPDIVEEIYRRNMQIDEINTNGYFISKDFLDRMQEIGCHPEMKISFDGVGCHDWMRNHKGAEEKTLAAMKLCVENGFRTGAQVQLHKRNLHTMLPTARLLSDMGVREMRIIRTTEVPRWAENAPGASLSLEEYYREMLAFSEEYIQSGIQLPVFIWQFLRLFPETRSFRIDAVSCCEGEYRDDIPGCKGNRGMIALTSSGEAVPCMQLSGVLAEAQISLGNLHRSSLHDILTSGKYLDSVCMTVGELAKQNGKCGDCKYFKYCTGGCRALGFLLSGQKHDFAGPDLTKCAFFENGWYTRVSNALSEWKNLAEIPV